MEFDKQKIAVANLSTLVWMLTNQGREHILTADIPADETRIIALKDAFGEVLGKDSQTRDMALKVEEPKFLLGAIEPGLHNKIVDAGIASKATHVQVNEAGIEAMVKAGVKGPVFDALRARESSVSPERFS